MDYDRSFSDMSTTKTDMLRDLIVDWWNDEAPDFSQCAGCQFHRPVRFQSPEHHCTAIGWVQCPALAEMLEEIRDEIRQ
jgi:hypothetical protein